MRKWKCIKCKKDNMIGKNVGITNSLTNKSICIKCYNKESDFKQFKVVLTDLGRLVNKGGNIAVIDRILSKVNEKPITAKDKSYAEDKLTIRLMEFGGSGNKPLFQVEEMKK